MSNLYYRGDTILLYVKFKDQDGNPATNVIDPVVRVVHEKGGKIINDLDWASLIRLSNSEYFYSLQISHDADYGFREVIYSGTIEGKTAQVVEDFHVIPNQTFGSNVVKIYGIVNQLRTGYPLIGANVKVSSADESEIYSETFTKEDGSWECFLYSGEYKFSFFKMGFEPQELIAQINDEQTEIRFNNVSLESESDKNKGKGVYTVSDKYQTKYGMPLNGLSVQAISLYNMLGGPVAEDVTNDDGEWSLFLDPGIYLLKIEGESMGEEYSYTFRLKVDDEGETQFENLSNNVAMASDEEFVGKGDSEDVNTLIVTDYVKDSQGNPIIDVQVNIFSPSNPDKIIAQDYTNVEGKWEVYLHPGKYVFEFYHPEFAVFTEERTI